MHERVRTGVIAAAGLAAVLALTGCSSDKGDGAGKDKGASAAPTAGGGEAGADAGRVRDIEGSWVGTSASKPIALSVKSGKALLVVEQRVCNGELTEMDDKPMLALKCSDGNKDRAMGAIESNDGSTLVISWDGGTKDTLKKTEPGALPPGLPTDLPTAGLPAS
ncbi:hypothetical protein [Streptomyces sp. NPDC059176]|uniref:hypothetical protein n=1 Tax=unclassified Streptomyces TaxID=2593676 RepID=UPI0036A70F5A